MSNGSGERCWETVHFEVPNFIDLPMSAEELRKIPSSVIRELHHLPFVPDAALDKMILNRFINQKIREGYFSGKIALVAAMPKSGSSFIADCLRRLQGGVAGRDKKYPTYMLNNEDSDYRLEMVAEFPHGGVIKYHTRASAKNLRIMDILGCKQMILLRSIPDVLAAMACHYREETIENLGVTTVYDHIRPLDLKFFGPDVDVHDTIDYLITGGYLTALLFWISDWLELRDQSVSIVCTYEDFMEDSLGFFENACEFFGFDSLTETEKVDMESTISRETADLRFSKEGGFETLYSKKYPYGWTGEVGIWRKYFSTRNMENYHKVEVAFRSFFREQGKIVNEFVGW